MNSRAALSVVGSVITVLGGIMVLRVVSPADGTRSAGAAVSATPGTAGDTVDTSGRAVINPAHFVAGDVRRVGATGRPQMVEIFHYG